MTRHLENVRACLAVALLFPAACEGGAPSSTPAAAPEKPAAEARPATLDAAALAREPDVLYLDVRTPGEFAGGHLEGALNIPVNDTARMAEAIGRKDRPVVLYCAAGGRSGRAMAALTAQGFTRLANGGGVDAAAAKTGRSIVR